MAGRSKKPAKAVKSFEAFGSSQFTTREAALRPSQSAPDPNKLGYDVGVPITIGVLE
jgi:hypothetical protein